MKKLILLSIVLGSLPLSMTAQDDMYYVPSKKAKAAVRQSAYTPIAEPYYSGSSRSVDEYNRRGSSYEVLPADTGDIISFMPVEGIYPDSLGDFQLTQQMSRWDGYVPTTAYWEGYAQGQRDLRGWHSPWYYSSYYPWYDSWYWDPWYYNSWYWYDPWYYSSWHYGWYDPWYYGSWYYRPYAYVGIGGGGRHVNSVNRARTSYANNGVGYGRRPTASSSSGSLGNRRVSGGGYYNNRNVVGSRSNASSAGSRSTSGSSATSGSRSTLGSRSNTGTRTYSQSARGATSSSNYGGYNSSSSSSGSLGGSSSSSGGYSGSRSSGGGGGGSVGGSRSGGGGGGGGRSGGGRR